jgi:urease accessory protein UreH
VIAAGDTRVASSIGREARLELNFEHRDGRTVLAHAYAEPPLRIGHTFDLDGAAYVILVCASPGVFPGDRLHHRVTVGPGARVLLASQSALQVHPACGPQAAAVDAEFYVADEGELHCLWDPVIPFEGAHLVQRTAIHLGRDSRLCWSDALMSGRTSRGEAWRFACIDHELRLRVDETLSYLERYTLVPTQRTCPDAGPRRATDDPTRRWVAGESHYVGTTLVHHAAITPELVQHLHHEHAGGEDVAGAVDFLDSGLMLARLLGRGGAPFARARAALRASVLASVFGTPGLVARR